MQQAGNHEDFLWTRMNRLGADHDERNQPIAAFVMNGPNTTT